MKKILIPILLFTIFLVACKQEEAIDLNELATFEVKQSVDEASKGDYHFRVESLKQTYQVGEAIELIGEITYLGPKNEVTMHHAASAIFFPMEEKVRDYLVDYSVEEIGVATVLKQGEAYREKFKKSGGYVAEDSPAYVAFMEELLNEPGFPPGYYQVNASTDFFVEGEGSIKLKAKVDFKVVDK